MRQSSQSWEVIILAESLSVKFPLIPPYMRKGIKPKDYLTQSPVKFKAIKQSQERGYFPRYSLS